MNPLKRVWLSLAVSACLFAEPSFAADPTAEELLKPSKLSLITAGTDLASALAEIEKQTGNKLVDETRDSDDTSELPPWNFSLSDREFWPLVDKFLDAAGLQPIDHLASEGLPVRRRASGMSPRYGRAAYVGPFRLEVSEVTSRIGMRFDGDRRASLTLEISWEPRLRPLSFAQSVATLEVIADDKIALEVVSGPRELSVEVSRDDHSAQLHVPVVLPPQQLESITALKGRLRALVSARMEDFHFDNLDKANGIQKSDGGLTVVLDAVRENQGLCELGMKLEYDEELPPHIAQGSWNFQNMTYLENAAGERIEHAGFETSSQGERRLGLAYYFDVPEGKLSDYTWVYQAPVAIVELPIEFELKDIPLP